MATTAWNYDVIERTEVIEDLFLTLQTFLNDNNADPHFKILQCDYSTIRIMWREDL